MKVGGADFPPPSQPSPSRGEGAANYDLFGLDQRSP